MREGDNAPPRLLLPGARAHSTQQVAGLLAPAVPEVAKLSRSHRVAAGAARAAGRLTTAVTLLLTSPPVQPPRHRRPGESGQALVEAALVLPAMVFLVLMILQLTMVQHARIMTDYAAFAAARAGVVFNAEPEAMREAAAIALLPTTGRTDTMASFAATRARMLGTGQLPSPELARRSAFGLPLVRVTVLSPKKSDFGGELGRHLGGREIDFDDVRPAAARANQLQIELTYFYRMQIPLANQLLQAIHFASRPTAYTLDGWEGANLIAPEAGGQGAGRLAEAAYVSSGAPDASPLVAARRAGDRLGGYFFPLTATYTMRMQSNPFLQNAGN